MNVITVWQPWATLIAIGLKPYEFRGWCAPAAKIGQRIGIHAGARPVRRSELQDLILRLQSAEAWTTCLKPTDQALRVLETMLQSPGVLPLSHILCTAVLGKPVLSREIVGEFGGVINDSDRDDHCNFAWPLTEIERLQPPVEARGSQGFWWWRGMP